MGFTDVYGGHGTVLLEIARALMYIRFMVQRIPGAVQDERRVGSQTFVNKQNSS